MKVSDSFTGKIQEPLARARACNKIVENARVQIVNSGQNGDAPTLKAAREALKKIGFNPQSTLVLCVAGEKAGWLQKLTRHSPDHSVIGDYNGWRNASDQTRPVILVLSFDEFVREWTPKPVISEFLKRLISTFLSRKDPIHSCRDHSWPWVIIVESELMVVESDTEDYGMFLQLTAKADRLLRLVPGSRKLADKDSIPPAPADEIDSPIAVDVPSVENQGASIAAEVNQQ